MTPAILGPAAAAAARVRRSSARPGGGVTSPLHSQIIIPALCGHIVCMAAEMAHTSLPSRSSKVWRESLQSASRGLRRSHVCPSTVATTAALDRLLLTPLAMSMGVVTSLTPSFADPSGSVTLMGACSSLAFWSCNIYQSPDSAPVWLEQERHCVVFYQGLHFT